MHRRVRSIIALLVILPLVAAASPAGPGQGPHRDESNPVFEATAVGGSSWPTSRGALLSAHQPQARGPVQPELAWLTDASAIGGWSMDGVNAGTAGSFDDLVLSSEGDLLVLAAREHDIDGDGSTERQGGLIALDGDDGTLRWQRPGIDDACKPAVGDDGTIWALLVLDPANREADDHPDASRALVAIDPADGTIVDGLRYSGDTVPLSPTGGGCGANGLQIAADGSVLVRDRTDFDPYARAVDPVDATPRWEVGFDRSCGVSAWFWTPPAVAPNADRLYVTVDGDDTSCPQTSFSMLALDLETGAVLDDVALPGPGIGSRRTQATGEDGRLLVNSDDYRPVDDRLSHLMWVSDEPGLTVATEVEINDNAELDSPACATTLCRRLHSVSLTGERIVGWNQGGLFSVDAEDLTLEWRERASDSSEDVVTDADGVAYVTRLSGTEGVRVRTIDVDGTELGSIAGQDPFGSVRTLGPLGENGLLYGRTGDHWFALSTSGTTRVSGVDRYETAVELSRATFDAGAPVAFVATGADFPDALSGGVPAALEGAPMLLVRPTSIPDVTVDELQRLDPGRIVILGGTAAVGASVATALEAYTDGEVERWSGDDRYATAARVSEETFRDPDDVGRAYIASGTNFPDALSGVPAAALAEAPVLLVRPNGVPSTTLAELSRLDVDELFVLGGTAAVSTSVAQSLAAFGPVERLDGSTRYATSAAISAHAFGPATDTVFVATGGGFADALSAGAVAGAVPGPVLLTEADTLPAVQAAEITRLDPDRVVIIGGSSAVEPSVAAALSALIE